MKIHLEFPSLIYSIVSNKTKKKPSEFFIAEGRNKRHCLKILEESRIPKERIR